MLKKITPILMLAFMLVFMISCGSDETASVGTDTNPGTEVVVDIGTGTSSSSVDLSWTPPTENTNGSPLTDITGYKVYYGLTANSMTETCAVMDANASSVVVPSLLSKTNYFFAVKTINSKNVESDFSNVVSKITQ